MKIQVVLGLLASAFNLSVSLKDTPPHIQNSNQIHTSLEEVQSSSSNVFSSLQIVPLLGTLLSNGMFAAQLPAVQV